MPLPILIPIPIQILNPSCLDLVRLHIYIYILIFMYNISHMLHIYIVDIYIYIFSCSQSSSEEKASQEQNNNLIPVARHYEMKLFCTFNSIGIWQCNAEISWSTSIFHDTWELVVASNVCSLHLYSDNNTGGRKYTRLHY